MSPKANTDTTEGDVAAVNSWQKGNGYFVKIVGDENDYYAFGAPKVKKGHMVQIEYKAGDGNFSDKMHIIKIKKVGGVAQSDELDAGNGKEDAEYKEASQIKAPLDKSAQINRAVALKTATELMKVCVVSGAEPDADKTAEETLGIAEKFLEWLENEK